MARKKADLLLTAKQIVTLRGDHQPRTGKSMSGVSVIQEGALAVQDEKIIAVGPRRQIESDYTAPSVLDCPHSCVTPGLIDPHTHLVFAGTREKDFYARANGVSYEEIARKGGGIRDSVRKLRAASREELRQSSLKRLQQIMAHGTTTCEVKSGYGLNWEDEIKTLEVIKELQKHQPVQLTPTFLGAHEFPDEYQKDRAAYVKLLCEKILPDLAKRKLARYCDIFCEKDVFAIEDSRVILMRARELGFELKLHADELAADFGGAELAAEMHAVSADHLVMISKQGIRALSQSKTIAVLLPATTFFLGKEKYAPARDMIEQNVAVALATDLNPGSSNTESLQVVMTLAALKLKMTPEEILTAVTHNAACAIGESKRIGRLQEAMQADFVVWDLPDYSLLPYHFGGNRASQVFKAGKCVWPADS